MIQQIFDLDSNKTIKFIGTLQSYSYRVFAKSSWQKSEGQSYTGLVYFSFLSIKENETDDYDYRMFYRWVTLP